MVTYAKLRSLTEPREKNLDQTFQRLADSLRDSGKTAVVQCTILVDDAPRRWTLDLGESDCRLQSESVKKPDLEIITRDTTWWEIAEGRLSPVEAFTQGRLRILGDTELGSHLLRLAGDNGAVAICKG
jgi:putative sterol carrier protein